MEHQRLLRLLGCRQALDWSAQVIRQEADRRRHQGASPHAVDHLFDIARDLSLQGYRVAEKLQEE